MTIEADSFVPVDPDDVEFHAKMDGLAEQTFPTLQSAMAWAEDLENPTGSIDFQGKAVVVYRDGGIDAV